MCYGKNSRTEKKGLRKRGPDGREKVTFEQRPGGCGKLSPFRRRWGKGLCAWHVGGTGRMPAQGDWSRASGQSVQQVKRGVCVCVCVCVWRHLF